MSDTATATPTARAASEVLGAYYENLIAQKVPDVLAHEIVLDAAKRLHGGDISYSNYPVI